MLPGTVRSGKALCQSPSHLSSLYPRLVRYSSKWAFQESVKISPNTFIKHTYSNYRDMHNRKQIGNSASSQGQLQSRQGLNNGEHPNHKMRIVSADDQPPKQSPQSRGFYRLNERRSDNAVLQSAPAESAKKRTEYLEENGFKMKQSSDGHVVRLIGTMVPLKSRPMFSAPSSLCGQTFFFLADGHTFFFWPGIERRVAARKIKRLVQNQQKLQVEGASKEELAAVRSQIQVANVDYNYATYYPMNQKYLFLYPKAVIDGKSQSVPRSKPPLWHVARRCLMEGTLDRFRNGEFNDEVPNRTVIREVISDGSAADTPERSAITENGNNEALYSSYGITGPKVRLPDLAKAVDNDVEDSRPLEDDDPLYI